MSKIKNYAVQTFQPLIHPYRLVRWERSDHCMVQNGNLAHQTTRQNHALTEDIDSAAQGA